MVNGKAKCLLTNLSGFVEPGQLMAHTQMTLLHTLGRGNRHALTEVLGASLNFEQRKRITIGVESCLPIRTTPRLVHVFIDMLAGLGEAPNP